MKIIESKKFLQENGYCFFNLTEFNPTYFEIIKENFQCNENKNFKNACKNLKITICHEFQSYEDAEIKKNETISLTKNDKNYKCDQIWFNTHLNNVLENINKNTDSSSKKFTEKVNYLTTFLEKSLGDITKYFFDINESQELSHLIYFTYYSKDCYLNNHSDGTGTGRICALLIYLNETYDEKDGGILILNNKDKVVPTIGTVAIIDLQTFDIPHMVSKVTGGIGRYAILSFVKIKENEFIH